MGGAGIGGATDTGFVRGASAQAKIRWFSGEYGMSWKDRSLTLSIVHPVCVPITMTAPVSHLTGLPVETLEQISLHLSGQDIIRIEAVRE